MRREVGEDLHQLIEVDQDAIGIHENVQNDEGDGEGKKKGKKKDKGKEQMKRRSKAKGDKEKEDQEFLVKFVPLKPLYSTQKLRPFPHSYILNRGWIDRSAKRFPTYTEVTSVRNRKKGPSKAAGSEDEEGAATDSSGSSSESEVGGDAGVAVEDQDEFDDVADVFESSYNFRFEEPYVVCRIP